MAEITPEKIAEELTEAQRKAVLKIGDPKRPFGGMFRTGLCGNDEFDLKHRGIVHWHIPAGAMGPVCCLTSLGFTVREFLVSPDKGQR